MKPQGRVMASRESLIFDILRGKDTLSPALSKSQKAAKLLDKSKQNAQNLEFNQHFS